jgi:hypothetical protein
MGRQINTFKIKRQAHAVSRSDAGFNPFGHIWNNKGRRQTWDGETERHLPENDIEPGPSMGFNQTAPTLEGAQGAFRHSAEGMTSEDVSPHQVDESEQERPGSSGGTVLASNVSNVDFTPAYSRIQLSRRERLGWSDLDAIDPVSTDEPKKTRRRLLKNCQPKEPFTVGNQIQRTLLGSWLNFLLVCVPVGISLGAVMGPSLGTFFVNYAAVVPLYWLGDFAMTEIGLRTGALISNYIGISTR